MTSNSRIPWIRIAAEGVAIVTSILLAFAIQAWWEGRGEAELRDTLLRGLLSDFRESEVALDYAMAGHARRGDAASRWLVLARSAEASRELIPVADTLLTQLLTWGNFEPSLGTLEALLNGEDLHALRSPELSRELTAWYREIELFDAEERQAVEGVGLYKREVMGHGVSIADLAWYPDSDWMGREAYPIEPRHTQGYMLLTDSRVESLVSDLWWGVANLREFEETLRERMTRIIGLLEAELGLAP